MFSTVCIWRKSRENRTNRENYLGRDALLAKAVARLATIVTLAGAPASAAWAEEGTATTILKAMAEYVSRQEHLTLKYDTDIEVVTPAVEKIQFGAPDWKSDSWGLAWCDL